MNKEKLRGFGFLYEIFFHIVNKNFFSTLFQEKKNWQKFFLDKSSKKYFQKKIRINHLLQNPDFVKDLSIYFS